MKAPSRPAQFWVITVLSILFASSMTALAKDSDEPVDPMAPTSLETDAITSPIRLVTIATGDLNETRRFYQGGFGLAPSPVFLSGKTADELSEHYGMKGDDTVGFTILSQPFAYSSASVRVIETPSTAPTARPAYSSRYIGPLGFGFPGTDLDRLTDILAQLGFGTTAGVTRMNFPRADGTEYEVGEVHFKAPDDILVLGVDRGEMQQVGPVDAALGNGGVAYCSLLAGDIEEMGRFLSEVLGYEKRRAMSFTATGPGGGMQDMHKGEAVAFQQWFSPGSKTGYFVVMELLDGDKRERATDQGGSRGIFGWTVETDDLDEIISRWQQYKAGDTPNVYQGHIPGLGTGRSIVIETSDGTPVEIVDLDNGTWHSAQGK